MPTQEDVGRAPPIGSVSKALEAEAHDPGSNPGRVICADSDRERRGGTDLISFRWGEGWVVPFPMSCDIRNECACLDPRAQEKSKGGQLHTQG
ncbi:hypothetical protein AAFF_G00253640 [Aldrovandia affinis]|uniref:Uncharacterized protein n=1 Tax=Aldrovandia affinis TaxID=143900 RepID=A0AAD7STU9_9TELE|nr:hypothetical protein AAFF_G00253640 [Aldrovandia affinis]